MDLVLVYFKDDGSRRDFRVKAPPCVIGRQDSCDLQVPLPTVSRTHCEIRVDGDRVLVRDLGSSNGTFVNSRRIEGEEELEAGDRLALGSVVLTVQINGSPAHVEPPLLDAPSSPPPPDAAKPVPSPKPAPAKAAAAPAKPAPAADPGDSDADIADLISKATDALNDDSSAFDFDFDLDDDEPKSKG